jgi:Leishmanolysin
MTLSTSRSRSLFLPALAAALIGCGDDAPSAPAAGPDRDIRFVSLTPANSCGDGPAMDQPLDDLIILVTIADIDGPGGVLGQASPCFVRDVGYLPALGHMIFDSADLDEVESAGLLSDVITHEMGHVLGYGTLWDLQGMLADPVGAGGTDPHFTGPQALAAFDAAGGEGYAGAKVPLEDQGGPGTADAHWRESVFDNELMTGYLNLGVNPLSAVSIASLGDAGYTVDPSVADPFTILPALRMPRSAPAVNLVNDIAPGPIRTIDRKGRITGMLRARR